MSNSSKHVWACRAETPAEKLIRIEWLAQRHSVDLDKAVTSSIQDQGKLDQTE